MVASDARRAFLGDAWLEYNRAVLARPLLLLALLSTACRFDVTGQSPPDGPRGDRVSPEARLDDRATGERGDLRSPEAAAGVCAGKPEGAPVCSFEANDTVGAAGVCQGGALALRRYCFVEAPCLGGLCSTTAPDGCTGDAECGAGRICAGFLNQGAGKIVTSCVTKNAKNGSGGAGSACSSGQGCASGHCTAAGTCYRPCAKIADTCPSGTACGSTTIPEGIAYPVSSCLKPTGADAGAPLPDLGAADSSAGPVDGKPSTE